MGRSRRPASDDLVDPRDGLTRVERVILLELKRAQDELAPRAVPAALLYGRVVEHVNLDVREFQQILTRLTGRT